MEMEGRGYSEFYRNTSEEMFIKTVMDSSIGMPAPTMEMLGFKNLTQTFRTDSEELFKSWLTNGENNGPHSTAVGHRPRQASRRISTELSGLANQSMAAVHKKPNDDSILFQETIPVADDSPDNLDPNRIAVERGLQASNMFLAKAWFHSSQPMTRSRSSELRRRYAAMQNPETPISMEPLYEVSGSDANGFKQETMDPNGFNNIPKGKTSNQFNTFMSPSNSSSSTFNHPQMDNVDKVSSIVSMLKGTIERKKISNQVDKEAIQDGSFGCYNVQQPGDLSNQGHGTIVYENQGTYQDASTIGVRENGILQTIEESLLEEIMGPVNTNLMNTMSRETSQSESSTAPPVFSKGFDICDDPCVSAQTPSGESSRTLNGNGRSPEDSSRNKDFRQRRYDNSKDDLKRGGLIQNGSGTSSGSVDRSDPTKKRRVERSRKMAEAKERNSTPAVPSDMQSILKRCENLEKEVRSLKLNLAFMNRKDSEQTKQIEELQKQNQELTEEKERLLEEIERIISETGKM